MLVAGPSHSSYHSYSTSDLPSASTHRRDSSSKSNGSSTASDTNSNSSSLSSKYNLIKTFAERLNRGTELLKQTVQKAILPTKKPITPTPDDPLILSPGKIHRRTTAMTPESDSGDSLKIEVTSHFKPIRIMPQTPKRRNQSSLKHPTPKIIRNNTAARLNNFKPLICPKKLVRSSSSAFLSLVQHYEDEGEDNSNDEKMVINKSESSNDLNSSNESKASTSRSRGIKRKLVTTTTTESVRKSTRQTTKTNKISQHSIKNKKLKTDVNSTTAAAVTLTLKEQQERADYEFAKKLQSQLNVTIFDDDDDDSCLYPIAGTSGGNNNSNTNKTRNSGNSNQEKCYNLRRTKANFIKPNYDEGSSFVSVRRSTRRKNISY